MNSIKKLSEFLNENASDVLSLKREIMDDSGHRISFGWILNGKEIGEMLVAIENGRASIVLYSRYKHIQSMPGIGYTFIKMCIDSLLEEGLDVVSGDSTRNPGSNLIWDKLEGDYDVHDSIHRGSPCKIIYAK
jgi:hypothetical protein